MGIVKKRKLKKIFWIWVPLAITSGLWSFAKYEQSVSIDGETILVLLSQITALWGLILLSLSYLLAARIKQLEYFFGGLDKIYKLHKSIGQFAFLLITLHPALLILKNISDGRVVQSLLIPFSEYGSTAKTLGILSLYIYIMFIGITILKLLPYHIWKLTHNLIGIPFFFGAYHGLMAESDVKYYEYLKIWIWIVILVGILSYIYKSFFYYYIGPKFKYKVKEVRHNNGICELILDNVNRRINFEPGEFVYLSFRNNDKIPHEHHPFTVSSSPEDDNLRISFKPLGDFTEKMTLAKKGDDVLVYGPFGEFTSYAFSSYKKQLWIAGGIGITPFLSMLNYEIKNHDKKKIYFYYSAKTKEECIYLDEINDEIINADDNLSFVCNHSDSMGFLTADKIAKEVKDLDQYLILICGPQKMMQSLKDGFLKLGIKEDMIVFEEFNIL